MNTSISKFDKKYLYLISQRLEYIELCAMEMRHLFGKTLNNNYHLTNDSIDISRSPFIKGKITILYIEESVEIIEEKMIQDNLFFNNYRIHFAKFDKVPYKTRLQSMRTLGFTINGNFSFDNPNVEFVITKIEGKWIFGKLENNPNTWMQRRKKPYSYSHSLNVKVAKAVLNIAIENNFKLKVIDPCCGIGTVVTEGRAMGIDIKGYEIVPLVKQHCNVNLNHFGYTPDVTKTNMLETTKHFDVAILDLPYGHTSVISQEEQIALIRKTREISDKSVIITMNDMSEIINEVGFKIIDQCKIKKSNSFTRYVMLCV